MPDGRVSVWPLPGVSSLGGFEGRDLAKERNAWLFSYDPWTAPLGAPGTAA